MKQRMARLSTVVLAISMLAVAGASPAAAAIAVQLPSEVRPIELPPVSRTSLPNGLEVVVAERHLRPLVTIQLTIPAGHVQDPPERPGLAGFVADMLKQGTRTRSAQEIARAIEFVGGRLEASAGVEATTITSQVLSKDLALAMELVADVATAPAFPESEVEILRPQWQASVRQQFDDPGTLASLHADSALYGVRHPLGLFPSEQAVAAVTRQDMVEFYRSYYTPRGARLLVVGDVDPLEVFELARRYLGGWEAGEATSRPVPPPELPAPKVRFVEWPGQTQVRIELRQPGPAATVADWLAVRTYNYVLGGGAFASRLMEVVRARSGQTYDVHTAYGAYRFPSHFALSTYTRNDQLWQTLDLLRGELARFYRDGITPQELEDAKTFFIFSYPMRMETLGGLAATLFEALWLGRGLDWVSRYPLLIRELSLDEVNAAIRRYFDPDRFAITLLGDPSVLKSAPPTVWGVPASQIERYGRTQVPEASEADGKDG